MPYLGPKARPPETVADWLLSNRKWLLLDYAEQQREPWQVTDVLENEICTSATAYEFIRALRPTGAIRAVGRGCYQLDAANPLGAALARLVNELRASGLGRVDRPPRPRSS